MNKTILLTLYLFGLGLAVLAVYGVADAIQKTELSFRMVVAVLSLTGGLGGLAASLVKNERLLIMPKEKTDKPGDIDTGFLADVFVGFVAANSVQLALAAFLDYKANQDNFVQKIVSLVALGFVAGFSGPKIMAGLAKKLESQVEKELRAADEKQQKQIDKSQELVKKIAQSGAERAMADPLLSEMRQLKSEQGQIEVAADLVRSEPESHRTASDWMILAYDDFHRGEYALAAAKAENALKAKPTKEMLWQIHNLLGLCYHWQQPENWKLGDNSDWFKKACASYQAAISHRLTLAEELLSKVNLAFVYLDAEDYKGCERVADEVIARESAGGLQAVSICDLARIVKSVAQVIQGSPTDAKETLEKAKDIEELEYIFNSDDLPADAIRSLAATPGLRPEIQRFLADRVNALGAA